MATKYNLDDVDRRILGYLIENARMPFLEIARECGISGAAIHQRVRKLEEAGIIAGSGLKIDPKALGYDVCAFVGIQLTDPQWYDSVVRRMETIPEVVECHFVTGSNALMVKIYCTDNEHLMTMLVKTFPKIEGVSQTQTFVSLDQAFAPRQITVL